MVGWYPPIHYGRHTKLLARLGRCRSGRSAAPQKRMTRRKLCLSAATDVDRRTHRHHPEPDPNIPVTGRPPPVPTFRNGRQSLSILLTWSCPSQNRKEGGVPLVGEPTILPSQRI